MDERKYRILSIGAHPDDADTFPCALLMKLKDAGWDIRLLSITDGSAGASDISIPRETLAETRRREAARSGARFGGRYDVWDAQDGRLTATLELRERLIRYIREFRPDVILTNRPSDYHPDHRNTSLLVQDASFLLTIPRVCDDTPHMKHEPAILFWEDGFRDPVPFRADILVPASEARVTALTEVASCHECQYFDFMYMPDHPERVDWPREKQVEELNGRFRASMRRARDRRQSELTERYTPDVAERIAYLESYQVSEYGSAPTEAFLRVATAAE